MEKGELLFSITKKDLKIEQLLSSKSGGQRRDKVQTAIRITHPASGAIGFSQDQRNQFENKRKAFQRLVESKQFIDWLTIEAAKYQIFDQVGIGIRASEDVIRTYRFPRGIIVDHRDGRKHNLKRFMEGNR